MSSPEDITMNQGDDGQENPQNHEPFTLEENIHQLNAIDKSVVELMAHAATALNSLTIATPPTGAISTAAEPAKPTLDAPSQKEAFRVATDSFLTTLHSIDVRMKRQILALEEAGIVRLSNETRQQKEGSGASKASLRPNGAGAVGNLDVGWLNSRSTRVERDMEMELWGQAKGFLEKEGKELKME